MILSIRAPKNWFAAFTVYCFIFVRNDVKVTPLLLNHERIHTRQQIEVFALAVLVMFPLCVFVGLSWWWLLATPAAFFVLYFICWLIEILLPPYDRAYSNICFETEAYYNENNPDYLQTRKPFAFLLYISNKKYSYKK